MKKKTFILLELLIAISIVSVALLPLLHFPFSLISKNINQLIDVELEPHTDCAFGEIRAELYANEIPWEVLTLERESSTPRTKEIIIKLSGEIERKVKQTIYVFTEPKERKTGKNNEELCLVTVAIEYEYKGLKKPLKKNAKFFVSRSEKQEPKKA